MSLSISELVHLYALTFVFAHLALCQKLYVIHDVYTSSSSLRTEQLTICFESLQKLRASLDNRKIGLNPQVF